MSQSKSADVVTRKEIACMAGVSYQTVKRNGTKWGLENARWKFSKRPALYFRSRVIAILQLGPLN